MNLTWTKRIFYIFVFLSGASALLYQVVWHKYLSILLGAQARATAIVLALFLGGISLGYFVFGRWSRSKNWNLLWAYTLVELGLGFWAFIFPLAFNAIFPWTLQLYGWLGVQSLWVDVFVSTLLIGFPTFLMGGTLPLLTQALSESLKDASHTHARIYGFNTVGACVGSLLTGYILIPKLNLPVSSQLGGILNLLIAATTYFTFVKKTNLGKMAAGDPQSKRKPGRLSIAMWGLLVIGFCSGFYTLTLETIFIRLMGLSTGSSNYNFTLIVSIFVFALGIGSLMARKIESYSETQLLKIQLGIGVGLLVLYYTADHWPYWVHLVRILFRDTPQSFFAYQTALALLFIALLIIPIGLCGLTLPLCFHLIRDRKELLGYRVGQLYAVNTVGCVLGALLGGYVFLKWLNLDQLLKICVGVVLFSSMVSLWLAAKQNKLSSFGMGFTGAALASLAVMLVTAPAFDKRIFMQPFRQQGPVAQSYKGWHTFTDYLSSSTQYLDYKDGPNTSVGIGVTKQGGEEKSRTILVNGKSDGNTTGDLLTMALTGNIPGLLAQKLDQVCVIGFGTGITVGSLAGFQETQSVDVVEIADTILERAHYFDAYNGGVSRHPKVKFYAMDAFRFLGGKKAQYNVIVSEPSNPWVSGVENLYSKEFYKLAKSKLAPGGMFVQWLQSYSFEDSLFRSVLATVTSQFKYVSVFQMLSHDVALVATDDPIEYQDILRAESRWKAHSVVTAMMQKLGITRMETFLAFEVIPSSVTPYLGSGADLFELETPRLSHKASISHYMGSSVNVHSLKRYMKEYYSHLGDALLAKYLKHTQISKDALQAMRLSFCESGVSRNSGLCQETLVMAKWLSPAVAYEVAQPSVFNEQQARQLASLRGAVGQRFSAKELQETQKMFEFYKANASPIAQLPIQPIINRLDQCIRSSAKLSELYGECLLQKAAIFEIVSPKAEQYAPFIKQFLAWFDSLSQSEQFKSKFQNAAEVLRKFLLGLAA